MCWKGTRRTAPELWRAMAEMGWLGAAIPGTL